MCSEMKNLLYLSIFVILLSSCINGNRDYTATLEIRRMALSRSPWDSTYVFFVDGYIWNHTGDSIWVIPFDKRWKGEFGYFPSYIVASICGQNIEFNKIGAVGKLNNGECFHAYLYKKIKEKQIPSQYLLDHVQELKFSYIPVIDSTEFIKDRLAFYNYMISWMLKDPRFKDDLPDYNSYISDFRLYKDSADMHFVNKMKFMPIPKKMRIKLLQDGRDASSLFL